jgi:hypothetical protein
VSKANWDLLKKQGTITDSFDSVISKLLKDQQNSGGARKKD